MPIHASELQEHPRDSCEMFAHTEGRQRPVTAGYRAERDCWRVKIGRNLEADGWVAQITNAIAA